MSFSFLGNGSLIIVGLVEFFVSLFNLEDKLIVYYVWMFNLEELRADTTNTF